MSEVPPSSVPPEALKSVEPESDQHVRAGATRGRRALLVGVIVVLVVGAFVAYRGTTGSSPTPASGGLTAQSSAAEYLNAGLDAVNSGDLQTAQLRFVEALEREPGYALALYNLGVVASMNGDLPGAKVRYEEAVAAAPAFENAYYNLGVTNGLLGDFVSATKDYAKVLELNPDRSDAKWNLGLALYGLGDKTRARVLLRSVIATDPAYQSRLPKDISLG